MNESERVRLRALVDGALAGLDGIVAKRLFGSDGYFVNGNLFALVAGGDGGLCLVVYDEAQRAALMAVPGASPWTVGARTMGRWIALPREVYGRPAWLRKWCRLAWRWASERPGRSTVTGHAAPRRVRPAVFPTLRRPTRTEG